MPVEVLVVQSAVRGFHFVHYYRTIWQPVEHEVLNCEREEDNPNDMFAIALLAINGTVVGHLPMEISRITKYLMDRATMIQAHLTGRHYRRSPLVQGGLEIPCDLVITMPGTQKSVQP